ncbi:hypothetical protein HPG69_014738, partial [Diceros bicornis minor]
REKTVRLHTAPKRTKRTRPHGLLQPKVDAVKLFVKEPPQPLTASTAISVIAPVLALALALTRRIPLPIPYPLININLGLLLSFNSKICTNRSPTRSSTNNFVGSNISNYSKPLSYIRWNRGRVELATGFNVEYTVGPFARFLLAEHANIMMINTFTTILFPGAFHDLCIPELYTTDFTIKTLLLTISFFMNLSILPRF